MTRVFLSFLALTTGAYAATLTATLKPATVNLGKSATLTLVCEGGIATTVEQTAAAGNLALSFIESTKSIDIVGGVTRESTTFTYQVTLGWPADSLCPPSRPWLATGKSAATP